MHVSERMEFLLETDSAVSRDTNSILKAAFIEKKREEANVPLQLVFLFLFLYLFFVCFGASVLVALVFLFWCF